MARTTTHRWRLQGELVALDPLHVGGMGSHPLRDLPVARDGAGAVHIPGTSLAGTLRSLCGRELPGIDVSVLFGYQRGDRGHASFIVVEDAPLLTTECVELRQGVGIDRKTGAASTRVKYDAEVVPRGSRFKLDLVIEGPAPGSDAARAATGAEPHGVDVDTLRGLVVALKERLEEAKNPDRPFTLGAGKTRGLGRLELQDASLTEWRLDDPGDILDLALGGSGRSVPSPARCLQFTPQKRWAIEVHWEQRSPVYMKSDADGFIVDTLPQVARQEPNDQGLVTLVLSGAAIKGALRSHAERIVRTVRGMDVSGGDFLDQVRVPLVEDLFGRAGQKGGGCRGVLSVKDCLAKVSLSADAWTQLTLAGEGDKQSPFARFNEGLGDAGLGQARIGHHVAIDRWTGGAADALLFSVLETHGISWNSMKILVDVDALDQTLHGPALALLCLVLQDLGDGRIPLGFGGNRGLGDIDVSAITLQLDERYEVKAGGSNTAFRRVDVIGALKSRGVDLGKQWSVWVTGGTTAPHGAVAHAGLQAPKAKTAGSAGRTPSSESFAAQPSLPRLVAVGQALTRRARASVTLLDALAPIAGPRAAGVFYTPGAFITARWTDAGWKMAVVDEHVHITELPLAAGEVYEARAWDGEREVRWFSDASGTRAVLLAEAVTPPPTAERLASGVVEQPASPSEEPGPCGSDWAPIGDVPVTHMIDRTQVIWGTVVAAESDWSVLHEDRIGPLAVPLVGPVGQRVALRTREYVSVLSTGAPRGNSTIADERIVGFVLLER
ncbi:MAG: hypothetical protein AMXMBFR64_38850 [Myxococcales bacterium]